MKHLSKLLLILSAVLLIFSINYQPKQYYVASSGCEDIRYEPKHADGAIRGTDIDSVDSYSIAKAGVGWSVFDHMGFVDEAFQGARHVAWIRDEGDSAGGLQFFGYQIVPFTDCALIKHPAGEDQRINTIQAPMRADWHTLNGNGILFGCTINGMVPNKDYNLNKGEGGSVSITGYGIVATVNKIELRQYGGVSPTNIGDSYSVIKSWDKECPGQNFTIEITGNMAKIFLDKEKLYEVSVGSGRDTGLVTTYLEHNCASLSSVYMFNHTVNGKDYLKGGKVK